MGSFSSNVTSLSILLILSVISSGCGKSKATGNESAQPGGEAPHPRTVEVAVSDAVLKSAPNYIQATGTFFADEASDLAPEASGQVVATPVEVGDFVKQGAVVARLNDEDGRLRLDQAVAAEKQAQAALRQAEERLGLSPGTPFDATAVPEVRAALQQRDAAEAEARLAEANARRYAALVETGDVSKLTYDQIRTQAETARAQANASRQQYELALNLARQSNQAIASAQAQIESARAQVGLARKALSDTVIRAPFAGFISERGIAVGEYVTPSSKIATILRTNPIKLALELPEGEAGRLKPRMIVLARVAAYDELEFEGRVTAINPAISPTSRSISVEVTIENKANLLRSGMFATARILLPDAAEGIFIPESAILSEPNSNSSYVYVVENGTARFRVVQLGEAEHDQGLVRATTGVSPGEVVATSNLIQLFDGATVRTVR